MGLVHDCDYPGRAVTATFLQQRTAGNAPWQQHLQHAPRWSPYTGGALTCQVGQHGEGHAQVDQDEHLSQRPGWGKITITHCGKCHCRPVYAAVVGDDGAFLFPYRLKEHSSSKREQAGGGRA